MLHVPELSVSSNPWSLPALSKESPTALQLPTEGHDTEPRPTPGFDLAFGGRLASTPVLIPRSLGRRRRATSRAIEHVHAI